MRHTYYLVCNNLCFSILLLILYDALTQSCFNLIFIGSVENILSITLRTWHYHLLWNWLPNTIHNINYSIYCIYIPTYHYRQTLNGKYLLFEKKVYYFSLFWEHFNTREVGRSRQEFKWETHFWMSISNTIRFFCNFLLDLSSSFLYFEHSLFFFVRSCIHSLFMRIEGKFFCQCYFFTF